MRRGIANPDNPAVIEERSSAPKPRQSRRLSDKIMIAFHHACDQQDIEVAWELLNVLEFMAMRAPHLPIRLDRRDKESLVAAHERLWQIRLAAAET
jgi:hypothetical protein